MLNMMQSKHDKGFKQIKSFSKTKHGFVNWANLTHTKVIKINL